MRILLIGINFGGYDKRIVEALNSLGHDVYYMCDATDHYNFYCRVFGETITSVINKRYLNREIDKIPKQIDEVIVIVGRQLDNECLEAIKRKNPNARFILYLWDDVKRVKSFCDIKDYFEEIFSFDIKDCRERGFSHLPLFFFRRPQNAKKKDIDIYSAMFAHSERESIIRAFVSQAQDYDLKCKFLLSLGRFEYFKRINKIRKEDESLEYLSSPIPEEENYQWMELSKCILDVQFSGQIGLTMRTIESLGMKNKIITTNPSVQIYDFYTEENIYVIDRYNPQLDAQFVKTPYKAIDDNIYEKYSLHNWARTLVGEKKLDNYLVDRVINDIFL